MVGIGISPFLKKRSGVVYTASFLAWQAQVVANGGALSTKEKNAFNKFLSNSPTTFDRFWITGCGLTNRIAAKTSLANPTSPMITEVNSPTWDNTGFIGDGVSSYLNSNYNAFTDGVNFTLNNAAMYLYCKTDIDEGVYDMGADNNINRYIVFEARNTNQVIIDLNDLTGQAQTNKNAIGFYAVERTSNTTTNIYKNGVLLGTTNANPSFGSSPNFKIYILCGNNNGSPNYFSNKKVAAIGFGAAGVNQAGVYASIQQLEADLA